MTGLLLAAVLLAQHASHPVTVQLRPAGGGNWTLIGEWADAELAWCRCGCGPEGCDPAPPAPRLYPRERVWFVDRAHEASPHDYRIDGEDLGGGADTTISRPGVRSAFRWLERRPMRWRVWRLEA